MSDYSFSSDGLSSDHDSEASEISAFNSDVPDEIESEGLAEELSDAPIATTTRSSRRRSSRIRSPAPAARPAKIVIVDDSDASDYEDLPRERPRRPKQRKVRRVRRTLPLALVPEDVPWKDPVSNPPPDPEIVENAPSVAFVVIFINTFAELFADLPPYGPQDIERGVKEHTPEIELLFLRLLGLVLNRKKEIEPGRYSSALSELHALLPVLGYGLQFPPLDWKSKTAFQDLAWDDRLELLHVLIHWALANSERTRAYFALLDDASTMPWLGTDNDHCRYYLVRGESIEENRDTEFRVYKETNRLRASVSWLAVAATPLEVAKLAAELEPQGKAAAKLGRALAGMVSELEQAEDRRYKELRRQRRRHDIEQQAMQVLQGEGRYSGRTRGKRVDYSQLTYDRELDAQMRRPSRRHRDEEWAEPAASPPVPAGDRQSRRLRGDVTMDIEEIERDLEAAEARGRKRGREQAEQEREQERLEQERLEQERLEQERLEQQRLEQEREQQRLEQEREQRLEQQQLEQQRLEQQRLEQQRLEQQRLEQQQQQQKERLEAERLARERLEKQEREMPSPQPVPFSGQFAPPPQFSAQSPPQFAQPSPVQNIQPRPLAPAQISPMQQQISPVQQPTSLPPMSGPPMSGPPMPGQPPQAMPSPLSRPGMPNLPRMPGMPGMPGPMPPMQGPGMYYPMYFPQPPPGNPPK